MSKKKTSKSLDMYDRHEHRGAIMRALPQDPLGNSWIHEVTDAKY
jgi:hypothetical protein